MIDLPDKDEFARSLVVRIYQAGEKSDIDYDRKEFCLRGGGKAVTHKLRGAYRNYCHADDLLARERLLSQEIRDWFAYLPKTPGDFEDVKPDLLPVIRSRAQLEFHAMRAEVEGNEQYRWPYQVFGEHFGVAIVYDLPRAMRPVQQTALDAWGITFYEALEIAKENLRAIPSTFIGPTKDDGVYLSDTRDSYDAARLLLPELIQQFHILGDPVAMMPTRGSLLVLGSEDVKRLVGIVKGADRALGSPLYISGIALHYNGEEWVPWLPPPSHPAHIGFRGLQIRTWQHEYSEQEDLLDTLYAKDGESVDLAPYTGVQHPDGRPFSCTIWGPDDNSSLLPKTDLVLFGQGSEEMPRASEWDRVVQQAGELVEALDVYPPRYRVCGFPSEKQLAAMGNVFE